MKKFQKNPKTDLGKFLVIATSILLLVLVLSFAVISSQHRQQPIGAPITQETPTAMPTTHPLNTFLVIRNSGSTNSPGYTITLYTDGSGTLVYERQTDPRPQFHQPNKTFSPGTFQIKGIRQILSQIGAIQNIPNHYCGKSVSFGSVTKIQYNGQESGDISCIDSTDPQTYQNLKQEIDMLISQAVQ
jgi:hypothetical protein